MILKLLISASILMRIKNVAATSCHELQQSQLIALNERMNQMIDTISSLLPKSIKKLTAPVPTTTAPSIDYMPRPNGHEINYFNSQPAYSIQSPTPQITNMYIPPSYAPVPTAVTFIPPRHPNQVSTPLHRYTQPETGLHPEFPFSTLSSFAPPSRFHHSYEQPPQYANPMSIAHLAPPSYPPVPYSLIPIPHSAEYAQPHPFENPFQNSNIPTYAPGAPLVPLPVHISPSAYAPVYPNISELTQKYK